MQADTDDMIYIYDCFAVTGDVDSSYLTTEFYSPVVDLTFSFFPVGAVTAWPGRRALDVVSCTETGFDDCWKTHTRKPHNIRRGPPLTDAQLTALRALVAAEKVLKDARNAATAAFGPEWITQKPTTVAADE